MRKRTALLCLLTLLIAAFSFVGFVEAKYASSHDVTTELVISIAASKYDLTLDANGGAFDDTSVTKNIMVTYKGTYGALPSPKREGYAFDGWYTAPSDGTQIEADATVEITQDTTIYAHWRANHYTIAYHNNTGSGTIESTPAVYDEAVTLSANGFTKTGYTFAGWNTASDGSGTSYLNSASVSNLTSADGATVTLYAQWEANTYTVVYNPNYGAGGMANQTFTYNVAGTLNDNLFTRTGYTFDGWNTKADGTGTAYADKASVKNLAESGTVTLYAQWKPNTYTVSFNTQTDAVENPADQTVTFGQKYGTLPVLDCTGYTFSGWTPSATSNVYITSGSLVTTAGNHTLYAQWNARTYTVKYHANGGEGTMDDQVVEYDNMFSLRANEFTRENHNFLGWATGPDETTVEYIDKQEVVNLLESGTLDLYAVWAEKTYTVTFDYNLGEGTPPTKEVVYGKAYGVLPTYPTLYEHLFAGWYTQKDGGVRIFPGTIVDRQENHTLYAHWDLSPANEVIQGLVVKNNPDDNDDGVADAIYLSFACSSYFEKFNIPITDLIPGQQYRLSYTASNNASFGDSLKGYQSARYGSYILPEAMKDKGNINTAVANDIIATWDNRIEPDGTNDGSQKATNDAWLNGPFSRQITFTATKETMYWCWEFGLMGDGPVYEYNIMNTVLEPIPPTIEFGNKAVIKGTGSQATITAQTNDSYSTTFTFDGDGGCETLYYPISGLTAGTTYTITFDHEYNGNLINSTQYDYGCGIMNAAPAKTSTKMVDLGTWASNTFVKTTVDGLTGSATLTFTAAGETAYWVWNMANCSDSTNGTTKINITNFSAKHAAGGTITYYTAESRAGQADTLDLLSEEPHEISLIWEGIDDTNLDIWYPVDEQYPVVGNSYELAFEPADGCTMAEAITVDINDVSYLVYTDGRVTDGEIAPVYDSVQNILTIPAELLIAEAETVSITASAVAVESGDDVEIEPKEETNPTEGTEPTGETEATEGTDITEETEAVDGTDPIEAEDQKKTVQLKLTHATAEGSRVLQPGKDYIVVLKSEEGYKLPEIIFVETDGILYQVHTDGHLMEGGIESSATPSFAPSSGSLTIPSILFDGTTESVTITISAVEIQVESTEEGAAKNETVGESRIRNDSSNPSESVPEYVVSQGNEAILPADGEEKRSESTEDNSGPEADGTNDLGTDEATQTENT